MVLLLLFAFLSGLVTILTPCIWPLLPIVLSSSIAGKSHQWMLAMNERLVANIIAGDWALSRRAMNDMINGFQLMTQRN